MQTKCRPIFDIFLKKSVSQTKINFTDHCKFDANCRRQAALSLFFFFLSSLFSGLSNLRFRAALSLFLSFLSNLSHMLSNCRFWACLCLCFSFLSSFLCLLSLWRSKAILCLFLASLSSRLCGLSFWRRWAVLSLLCSSLDCLAAWLSMIRLALCLVASRECLPMNVRLRFGIWLKSQSATWNISNVTLHVGR